MKTKIISKLKNELLIIELPTKSKIELDDWYIDDCRNIRQSVMTYDKDYWEVRQDYIKIPPEIIMLIKDYTILGKPDEIKEQYARLYVQKTNTILGPYKSERWFKNYKKEGHFLTATESLLSALESEIYWENPIPKPVIQGVYDDYGIFHGGWDDSWISAFEEAQEKTFDRNRTLIFIKQ